MTEYKYIMLAEPKYYDFPRFTFKCLDDFNQKADFYRKRFKDCTEYDFVMIECDYITNMIWSAGGKYNVKKFLQLIEDDIISDELDAIKFDTCFLHLNMNFDQCIEFFDKIDLYEGTTEEYAKDCLDWDNIPRRYHHLVSLREYEEELIDKNMIEDLCNGFLLIK